MEEFESDSEIDNLRKIYDSLTPHMKKSRPRCGPGEAQQGYRLQLGHQRENVKMHRANLCTKLNVTSAVRDGCVHTQKSGC